MAVSTNKKPLLIDPRTESLKPVPLNTNSWQILQSGPKTQVCTDGDHKLPMLAIIKLLSLLTIHVLTGGAVEQNDR